MTNDDQRESLSQKFRRTGGLTRPGQTQETTPQISQIFSGSLKEKPIPWLLQAAEHYEATGRLQIGAAMYSVMIEFGLGRPINARSPLHKGTDAILELFTWADGKISFQEGVQPEAPTVEESVHQIIKNGEAYVQNMNFLQNYGINGMSILQRAPGRLSSEEVEKRLLEGAPLGLTAQKEFYGNIYGTLNLKEAAEKMNLSEARWMSFVVNMLKLGLLLTPDGLLVATAEKPSVKPTSTRDFPMDSMWLTDYGNGPRPTGEMATPPAGAGAAGAARSQPSSPADPWTNPSPQPPSPGAPQAPPTPAPPASPSSTDAWGGPVKQDLWMAASPSPPPSTTASGTVPPIAVPSASAMMSAWDNAAPSPQASSGAQQAVAPSAAPEPAAASQAAIAPMFPTMTGETPPVTRTSTGATEISSIVASAGISPGAADADAVAASIAAEAASAAKQASASASEAVAEEDRDSSSGETFMLGVPQDTFVLNPHAADSIQKLLNRKETDILSFDAFQYMLDREFARAFRFGSVLTLILFCVRLEKGDMTSIPISSLALITDAINKTKREVDLLGHVGEQGFGIILPNVASKQACHLADRITVDLPKLAPSLVQYRPIIHFGIASVPQDATELVDLVNNTQKAMLEAVKRNISRVQFQEFKKQD